MNRHRTPIAVRFAAKYVVDETTGCWEWTGTLTGGYGAICGADNKMHRAHRVAYELEVIKTAKRRAA